MAIEPHNALPKTLREQYDLVGRIGAGSYATVYRARRRQADHSQDVAIKLFDLSGHSQRADVLREAANLSALQHRNIVAVYDVGFTGDRAYLVMEYLQGRSLAQRLSDEATMSVDEAVSVTRQILEALDYVHRRGVLHCDLSPANVFLCGEDNAVKLIDFGVAVNALRGMSLAQGGTLNCSAPELFLGAQLDERADLFSVGVLLRAMLTVSITRHTDSLPDDRRRFAPLVSALTDEDRTRRPGSAGATLRLLDQIANEDGDADIGRGKLTLVQPHRAPFVGAREELVQLQRAIEQAAAGNRGCLVTISGPSGSGKSRLVREAQVTLASSALELSAMCLPMTATIAYTPVVAALDALIARCGSDDAVLERVKAAALIAASALDAVVPDFVRRLHPAYIPQAASALASDDDVRQRLAQLATFFLSLGTETMPLVLFVDDVQWADPATLRLLERLAAQAHKQSIVLILGYRSEAEHVRNLFSGYERALSLSTRPITAPDLSVALERAFSSRVLDPQTIATLTCEAAEGNAFFVWEILRSLVDSEALTLGAEGVLFDEAGARALLKRNPPADLLRRRLTSLDPTLQRHLAVAAVLGRVFSEADVTAIGRTLGDTRAVEFTEAIAAGLVRRESGSGSLAFTHDKVVEAAYASLTEQERMRAHGAAAERLAGRDMTDRMLAVAHFANAGRLEEAAAAALRAAHEAEMRFAWDIAFELLRRVDDWHRQSRLPVDDAARASLLMRLGATAMQIGQYGAAIEAFAALEGMPEQTLRTVLPDDIEHARIVGLHATATFRLGRFDDAYALHDRCLLLLGVSVPRKRGALLLSILAQVAIAVCIALLPQRLKKTWQRANKLRAERALQAANLALHLIYTDAIRSLAAHLRGINEAEWLLPCREQAMVFAQHGGARAVLPGLLSPRLERYGKLAVEVAESIQDPSAVIAAHAYASIQYIINGQFSEAKRAHDRVEQAAQGSGNPVHVGMSKQHQAYAALFAGNVSEALTIADRVCSYYECVGDEPGIFDAHYFTGEALLEAGDLEGAQARISAAARIVEQKPKLQDVMRSNVERGLLALYQSRWQEGAHKVAELQAGLALAIESCRIGLRNNLYHFHAARSGAVALRLLSELRLMRCKIPASTEILALFSTLVSTALFPTFRAYNLHALGTWLHARGEWALALAMTRRGLAAAERYATQLDAARCHLQLGELEDDDAAREYHLATGSALATRLGARAMPSSDTIVVSTEK